MIPQVRANVVLNTEEQITDYVTISGVENDIRFGRPYMYGGYGGNMYGGYGGNMYGGYGGKRPRQSRQSSSLNNNGHTAVSTFFVEFPNV